ncbi:DUF1329 domain-containing protein [Shewanella pealeana]|uniref:Sigma E regulatory protein, MucB/RseB n=1 Tax=Shewanella pealeana (strain ATCC 700345 / ANG-SQ1) TaxID=398579 RepID=A8H4K0_SHEPA|nr:DUF1329 domain-containing protein [Shewanella pealeana]ABV87487.1 protein of unknown function DUF1329 [Shewanella pealeana ATCC 700345]
MLKKNLLPPIVTSLLIVQSHFALASAPAEQVAKLGNELTCVGAIAAGNSAGTIPAYSGKWLGKPPGVEYELSVGQHLVDPYADDKPIYTIDGKNWQKYSDQLTVGQKAMFEQYPDTFKMPVYTGRRDFRYPDASCEVVKRNAVEAKLVDDGLGFTGYQGGVPFPIPDMEQPLQALANNNYAYRAFTFDTTRDIADVSSDGVIAWGRTRSYGIFTGTVPEQLGERLGKVQAYGLAINILPTRTKGSATVVSEPNNYAQGKRLAWNYNPGTRRVRQLPEYGFDTPLSASSGKLTIDSDRLMNGSPERYNWTLGERKEIFIPVNTYKVNKGDVKYDSLLQVNHANPEYMRYELRRVWVLEGKLKEDYRHKYGRRTMYLDEDNWHAIVADYYDTRDELVQHAFVNYYYAFDTQAFEPGSSFYHDLTSGGYVGYNLFQEQDKGPILNKGDFTSSNFTPAALRRLSH